MLDAVTFASYARKRAQQVKIGKPNDVAEKEKELKSALLQFLAGTGVAGALIMTMAQNAMSYTLTPMHCQIAARKQNPIEDCYAEYVAVLLPFF